MSTRVAVTGMAGLTSLGSDYATVMAATLYVIFDLEFPRLGLIRVDAADTAEAQTAAPVA